MPASKNTQFRQGQRVEYHPIGGRTGTSTSTGTIERVITKDDTRAGTQGVHVHASVDEPRYEIKNDNTGKSSAVKEENIECVLD